MTQGKGKALSVENEVSVYLARKDLVTKDALSSPGLGKGSAPGFQAKRMRSLNTGGSIMIIGNPGQNYMEVHQFEMVFAADRKPMSTICSFYYVFN